MHPVIVTRCHDGTEHGLEVSYHTLYVPIPTIKVSYRLLLPLRYITISASKRTTLTPVKTPTLDRNRLDWTWTVESESDCDSGSLFVRLT